MKEHKHFVCLEGQTLRMEPGELGPRLYLELPSLHFYGAETLVGYKMADGTEMVFEYRLTTRGRSIFEWRPGHPARCSDQDQAVCWLGGPMRSLGGSADAS